MVSRPKVCGSDRIRSWRSAWSLRSQTLSEDEQHLTFFLTIAVGLYGNLAAYQQATMAFTKQSRMDQMLDQKYRELVSEPTRRKLSNAYILGHILVEHRILFTWEF